MVQLKFSEHAIAVPDIQSAATVPFPPVGTGTAQSPTPDPFPPAAEIICPLTGEIVEVSDRDSLIDLFERLDQQIKRLTTTTYAVRAALRDLTTGDKKTRRVIGRRRAAKLEFASDEYDQPTLKEAWNAWPELARGYLKIGNIDPMLREVNKLKDSDGNDAFNAFRDMVCGARREVNRLPTVKVEK